MDHLPQAVAVQPRIAHIQVPYLDKYIYDNAGFSTFPSRMDFDKKRLLAGDFTQHSPGETAAFLQTWLFFGMMREVLGEYVDLEHFVHEESQSLRVVTTKEYLPRYIERWLERLRMRRIPNAERIIRDCLQEVNSYSRHLSGGHLGPTESPLSPEISLSIMLLGATFNSAIWHWRKSVGFGIPFSRWGHSALLSRRMLEMGWCINDVARISEVGSIHLNSFASTLRRIQTGASHQNCTIERCVAHHVQSGSYPTKHVNIDCHCNHVEAPIEKVTSILLGGYIPIVGIAFSDGSEVPHLDVAQVRQGSRYCAISHVWSDGLGNAQGNSLPGCQLQRLRELANALSSQSFLQSHKDDRSRLVYVWIDTLCIPRQQPLRRTAISRMALTYSQATNVLVLDSELQQIPFTTPTEELLVRASSCGWMRRVWTLLEGSLGAQKLCVQFLGGALRLADAKVTVLQDWNARPYVVDSIGTDVGRFHETLNTIRWGFQPRSSENSQSHAFGVALHGFIGRATSWKGDELICLAILLGFSPSALTELQGTEENREFKLLTNLTSIPHGLLFCSGPKFDHPGYRWMCRDFWRARPYQYYRPARNRPGVGLEITLPGFIISPMLLSQRSFLFQNLKTHTWYKASYDKAVSNLPPNPEALAALDHEPEKTKLGMICPTLNITRSGPREIDQIPGALVSISKESNTTLNFLDVGRTAIYTKYISYVLLTMPDEEEVDQEKTKHGDSWTKYLGTASRAPVFVGQKIREKLGLEMLSDSKEEWLDQTWYVS